MKLTNDDIKSISLFEQLTGAIVKDCVLEPDHAVFVVKEGDLGRAIGKQGSAISRVRHAFNRNITVVEYAESIPDFAANIFSSIKLGKVDVNDIGGKKTVIVHVNAEDRGNAIGKNGNRIKIGRMLLERHFGADLKLSVDG